ncbi:ArsR/SmtB family transcription factor [Geodermatophilus sp. SYSU D00703]
MSAYRAAEAWNALGDPTRRAIVECLAERPRAVGELAGDLPISRPAVSQHLRVLKEAGLVTDRVAGTRRIYRLDPAGVAALRDQLDTYWNRALAGYQDVVASPDVADPADAPDVCGEQDVTGGPGQERP